ncbi:AI-2E family transporter, partial [Acinetobacter baumannii]
PVAVVFAVLAGAQLAGFLGMLIALPVAAVIVVLLKHLRENYERSSFYAPSYTLLIQEGNIEQLHVETENTKLDLEVKKQQDTDTPNLSDQK